jgi:hypothetical protein
MTLAVVLYFLLGTYFKQPLHKVIVDLHGGGRICLSASFISETTKLVSIKFGIECQH